MGGASELPEELIHKVISYMKTKEVTRTSIICKAWYNACLTCPTLSFDENFCYRLKKREKFMEFMSNTLRRYQERRLYIEKLNMDLSISDSYSASLVDEWIAIAVQNGVQSLRLKNHSTWEDHEYTLPCTIFEFAKTLRELIVIGSTSVKLWSNINNKGMLNHLHQLFLWGIRIDDDAFEGIIARCPLIAFLFVHRCVLLKRIKINKVYNLKVIIITALRDQSIEIEAPNLKYLNCNTGSNAYLDLCETKNLKSMSLGIKFGSPTYYDNLMQIFSQVEVLKLYSLGSIKRISLSSPCLKRVSLESLMNLKEIRIDAPNMELLEILKLYVLPDLYLINASPQLVSLISLSMRLSCKQPSESCKMKGLLAKLIPSKISIKIDSFHDHECTCADDIRLISTCPPIQVENLELDFYLQNYIPLDLLFMICHPKAIIVNRYHNLTKFLQERLIVGREGLKQVRIEIYDVKDKWKQSDSKSLSEAPQHWKVACFRLEWEELSGERRVSQVQHQTLVNKPKPKLGALKKIVSPFKCFGKQ